ncbi:MAG: DUF5819 family protein [Armatimonadota bacterium]|nr:DUF5819 family protein [Armatimonadota bacterium]
MFAPDPIRSNYVLSARSRTRGGVSSSWKDLTQPMLARHHASRTSPMSRMLRVQQNAVRFTLGFSYDEWRPLICRRDPDAPVCRGQTAVAAQQREIGGYLLRRIASVSCDALVGPGQTEAVQLAILIHTPPPWSRRNSADQGTTRLLLLPWAGYEPVR